MTAKEFIKAVSHGKTDIVQLLLYILDLAEAPYCLIGGLAVNAYAEPVVSFDLDVVADSLRLNAICTKADASGLAVEQFGHSINLKSPKSDLLIQLQTD